MKNYIRLEKIVKEREAILNTLNQYTGALEELTYLMKKGYINSEIYKLRFDKIRDKFDVSSIIFKELGDEAHDLRR